MTDTTTIPERTWEPGDQGPLPPLPDSAYPPGAVPLPEPAVMSRTPWSAACALRHDHGPAGCDGTGPRGTCGCPCHAATPPPGSTSADVARLLDVVNGPATGEARITAATTVALWLCSVAAELDPAGLAAHPGTEDGDRLVRRLGRALTSAARLHRDLTEADRG